MAVPTKIYTAFDGQIEIEMETYSSWGAFECQERIQKAIPEYETWETEGTAYRVFGNFLVFVSRLRNIKIDLDQGETPHEQASFFAEWWATAGRMIEQRQYTEAWDHLFMCHFGAINSIMVDACNATLRTIPAAPDELKFDETDTDDKAFLAVASLPSLTWNGA